MRLPTVITNGGYYAFVKADPWGVERYLAMRGVKGANIQGIWMLRTSRCTKTSKLIGEFSMYQSIFTECDESTKARSVAACANIWYNAHMSNSECVRLQTTGVML